MIATLPNRRTEVLSWNARLRHVRGADRPALRTRPTARRRVRRIEAPRQTYRSQVLAAVWGKVLQGLLLAGSMAVGLAGVEAVVLYKSGCHLFLSAWLG
jgi:hypothetical protein